MKTFTIQESFNFLMASQDKLGDKITLLAELWGASRFTVSGEIKEVVVKKEVAKTPATKKVATLTTKRRHKVAKKVVRATTVIFAQTVEAVKAAAAVSLLRSLGRKSQSSLAYGEVLNLSVEVLAYASKEEAVSSAWNAFKAAAISA